MRRLGTVTAVAALATLLMACSTNAPAAVSTASPLSSVPAALQTFYAQTLDWKPCHNKLQCATYQVPLDYAKPTGVRLTIAVARALATGTSRGSLVVNPGGPGGSGIEYIQEPAYVLSTTARRNFDLVGFDPRGVGASAPLWCFRGARLDQFLDADPTPDTAAERAAFVAQGKALAAACVKENKQLMAHVSASEMARDLDILRALLGEQQLRYLGKSWGTVLGTVYAALFPGRVGSFVLDGAVDLQVPSQRAAFEQGQGFEQAADRFAAWCATQSRCPLGATQAKVKQALVALLAGLDAHPMPTDNPSRPLTEAQAYTAVLGPLYVTDGGWDWLMNALVPAVSVRNGTQLQAISDWFVERSSSGTYANNANTAIYTVNCLDDPGSVTTAAQAQKLALTWAKKLPLMGRLMAWSDLPCAGWPAKAVTDIAKLRVTNVPPILVVGATYDPATPMAWARGLASELPGSRLLERLGDGHTSYANGDACTDRHIDAFLMSDDPWSPTLPPEGTVCGATAA